MGKQTLIHREAAEAVFSERAPELIAQAKEEGRREAEAGFQRAIGSRPSADPVPGYLPSPQSGIYAWDNPWQWTVPQSPTRRPQAQVSLEVLRRTADTYDVLRACIQHLKRELNAVPFEIAPKDKRDKSPAVKNRIKEVGEFFKVRGGLGGQGKTRADFEGMLVEDLCVIGAAAVHFHPTRGGGVYEAVAIDASTIRPRVDAYGWPGPGEQVFEQWVQGLKVGGYTREELSYYGLPTSARSYTPYYASPVEWLIFTTMTALKSDEWNRAWLTDGNVHPNLLEAPDTWSPQQIISFTDYLDKIFSGDSAARQKMRVIPKMSGVVNHSRKDQDFQEFELWLLRRTCALMGVQPASMGFAGEQYKVSQADSMESTSEFGVGVLLDYRLTLYNDLLERMGYDELEGKNINSREEKATERAERNSLLVSSGIKTPNEARADEGLDPIDNGDELFVPSTASPIDIAVKPPAPAPPMGGMRPVAAGGSPPRRPSKQPSNKGRSDGLSGESDLRLWEKKALNRLKAGGSPSVGFQSDDLPTAVKHFITTALPDCTVASEVREVFVVARSVGERETERRLAASTVPTTLSDWRVETSG